MAVRKMIIPFKNFLKNTIISSSQMNDNLAEIEYTFNEFYNAYNDRVKNTYSKEEVKNCLTIVYDAMEHLTDEEVSNSSLNGVLNPLSDGFVTDFEIAQILGLDGTYIEVCDMGYFGEGEPMTLDGGEF